MWQIRLRFVLGHLICSLLVPALPTIKADEPRTVRIVTDATSADPDFQLQGEYSGTFLSGPASRRLGLQVVALGKRQFRAVLLPGGLPGDGWDCWQRWELDGERIDHELRLVGKGYQVAITVNERAAIVRCDGDPTVVAKLPKVTRVSPTMGAPVPEGGIQLFAEEPDLEPADRVHAAQKFWDQPRLTDDGFLLAGTRTDTPYHDFRMHLEFRVPFMPESRGQSRGNSGVYLNSRHEVQILDSFGLAGEFNEAGSLYRRKRPDINMALPPLSWQTYDIWYRAPRFNCCGQKIRHVAITVQHNGIIVQNQVEIDGPTGAGKPDGPDLLPMKLQEHGAPVAFRNIWISPVQFPELCCKPARRRQR